MTAAPWWVVYDPDTPDEDWQGPHPGRDDAHWCALVQADQPTYDPRPYQLRSARLPAGHSG